MNTLGILFTDSEQDVTVSPVNIQEVMQANIEGVSALRVNAGGETNQICSTPKTAGVNGQIRS
jgi:hypothetical protein